MSRTVRVLFEFKGANDNELSCDEGEELEELTDHGDGWSTCQRANGEMGYVPSQYIEAVEESEANSATTTTPVDDQEVQQQSEPEVNRKKASREIPPSRYSQDQAVVIVAKKLRHYLFRQKFKQLTKGPDYKQFRTRNELIKEVMETERSYVNSLGTFVDLFYKPVKSSNPPILQEKQMKHLFSNIEQILSINNMLLAELEKAFAEWPTTKIGPPFKKYAPFMKSYTVYINNHDDCTDLIKQLDSGDKSLSKLREFLSEAYKNPRTERHKIDSFAILPVQRIPRYRMLLSELLKNTPQDHVEYNDISSALTEISTVAMFVNESKRKKEQSQIVLELSKQLKNRYNSFVQPNRQYLREAQFKIRSKLLVDAPYQGYLFQDVILLKEVPNAKKTKHAQPWYFFFFSVTRLVEKGRPNNEFSLEVLMEGNLEKFTLSAPSSEVQSQWEQDIEEWIANSTNAKDRKGIESDTVVMGIERINYKSTGRTKLSDFASVEKEYQASEKRYLQLDKDLKVQEGEMRKLFDAIRRGRLEKFKTEETMAQLVKQQHQLRSEIANSLQESKQRDAIFFEILTREDDAFKCIFGEEPLSDEMFEAMVPPVREIPIPDRRYIGSTGEPLIPLLEGFLAEYTGGFDPNRGPLMRTLSTGKSPLPVVAQKPLPAPPPPKPLPQAPDRVRPEAPRKPTMLKMARTADLENLVKRGKSQSPPAQSLKMAEQRKSLSPSDSVLDRKGQSPSVPTVEAADNSSKHTGAAVGRVPPEKTPPPPPRNESPKDVHISTPRTRASCSPTAPEISTPVVKHVTPPKVAPENGEVLPKKVETKAPIVTKVRRSESPTAANTKSPSLEAPLKQETKPEEVVTPSHSVVKSVLENRFAKEKPFVEKNNEKNNELNNNRSASPTAKAKWEKPSVSSNSTPTKEQEQQEEETKTVFGAKLRPVSANNINRKSYGNSGSATSSAVPAQTKVQETKFGARVVYRKQP